MQDPAALFSYETDADPEQAHASVMLVALGGFVDAGATQKLVVDHLLSTHESHVVGSFDVDQLIDYRGRRPMMTFDKDRFTSYDDPAILLHRVIDRDGTPFLLLSGPEPDFQWERMSEAVIGVVKDLGVELTVGVHGIPMAVPHTRAIGVTGHATNPALLPSNEPVFGTVQVPAAFPQLLELRLGELGRNALGYSVHVPHYLTQAEFPDAALAGLNAVTGATGLSLSTDDLALAAGAARAQLAGEVAGSEEIERVVHALEEQYDAFMRGRQRPSLLATDVSELPSADEIGAELEAFLREVDEPGTSQD